ncbi:MAG: ubiquitin carboxyl-terminal hydrolase [Verrucomicrobia bacterium]|nr:ubiquitin carboxyl-terminal hydrolase [Verrucomicrobiota bacterium]
MVTRSSSTSSLPTVFPSRGDIARTNSLPNCLKNLPVAEGPAGEAENIISPSSSVSSVAGGSPARVFVSAPSSPLTSPRKPPAAETERIDRGLSSPAGYAPQTPPRSSSFEVYSPDRGDVLSPLQTPPPPLQRQGAVAALVHKSEVHEAAKETSSWVSVAFQTAALFFCGALYYGGVFIYKRNYSLLIPATCCGLVSIVIGTWAEMLETVAELRTSRAPREKKNAAPSFQKGQPIAIDNVGNTCFINAPTQAIMNDAQYPRVFKEICQREIKRHEAFRIFLSLFPHATTYLPRMRFLSSEEQKATHDFVCPNLVDVFIRLKARFGQLEHLYLEKAKNPLRKIYPKFSEIVDLFRLDARREGDLLRCTEHAAWKEVYNEGKVTGALKEEFNRMKKDRAITECFDQWRLQIKHEIEGFKAYQGLINAYENALQQEQPVSYRTWISASPLGNVRHLMQNARGYSQEDVDQFLRCLTEYAFPEDHPEIFFSSVHEAEWMEFKEENQSPESRRYLEECIAKHQKEGAKADDRLSVLPRALKVVDSLKPECIFKISESLTEGADGQRLFQESQRMKETGNDPERSRCAFIDETDGRAKLFYRVREKAVIQGTPKRIILQLGRWKFLGEKVEKINCTVHMPRILKVNDANYLLKSIIVHEGEGDQQGHYSATILKEEKWWYTSDAFVDQALPAHLETALTKGYLYFYEKIETLPMARIGDAAV